MVNPKAEHRNKAVKPSTAYNIAVPFRYSNWDFAISPFEDS